MTERTILGTENYSDNWKSLVAGWVVLVAIVSVVTGLGFWGTLAGMTGVASVYWGLSSVVRSVFSESVEESSVVALGGRSETVQVVGRARPVGESLSTPFTGTDCVAYQVEVEEEATHVT